MDQRVQKRPGSRALAKQGTRKKILIATRMLLAERGYEGTTIRDIARAAGMSTGAFFASFRTKEEVVAVIVSEELDRVRSEGLRADLPLSRMRELMLAEYRFWLEHPGLLRAWLSRVFEEDGESRLLYIRQRHRMLECFREVFRALGVVQAAEKATALFDQHVGNLTRIVLNETGTPDLLERLLDRQIATYTG